MTQILYGAKHGRFPKFPLDWAKCGTDANYRGHHRRGENIDLGDCTPGGALESTPMDRVSDYFTRRFVKRRLM